MRILDVAERFANQHQPPLEIVFTGLRPSEKLHGDLISSDESGERRVHHLITHVPAPGLAPSDEMTSGAAVSDSAHMRVIALSHLPAAVDV